MSDLEVLTRKRLRILVVDDNLDQVRSMAYLLKDLGHEVEYAINGIVAIELARSRKPQVVLLDMRLPDTSGSSVARELRRNAGLVGTSIIGISGYPMNRADASAAGFDEMLSKPVDLHALKALLERNHPRPEE